MQAHQLIFHLNRLAQNATRIAQLVIPTSPTSDGTAIIDRPEIAKLRDILAADFVTVQAELGEPNEAA